MPHHVPSSYARARSRGAVFLLQLLLLVAYGCPWPLQLLSAERLHAPSCVRTPGAAFPPKVSRPTAFVSLSPLLRLFVMTPRGPSSPALAQTQVAASPLEILLPAAFVSLRPLLQLFVM